MIINSTLTSPKPKTKIPTKSIFRSLHESSRNGRDLTSVFNDKDNEFHKNKLSNLDSIKFNGDPSSDDELSNKKLVDDELYKKTKLGFNQTLDNYLKVSVGNDTYNLTKFDKLKFTDTTIFKTGNSGGYLLPNWRNICNDRINNGNISSCIKSTKTNSPTTHSRAASILPVGNSFM